jgi:uncharacterized protein (TIGR03000 family)
MMRTFTLSTMLALGSLIFLADSASARGRGGSCGGYGGGSCGSYCGSYGGGYCGSYGGGYCGSYGGGYCGSYGGGYCGSYGGYSGGYCGYSSYCYTPCYSYASYPCYPYYHVAPADKGKGGDKGGDKGKGDKGKGDKGGEEGDETSATIRVKVPANAVVYVDGYKTKSTSENRVFTTPALRKDRTYTYTFKAEVVSNGKKQTLTKDVTVRGGKETQVSFDMAETSAVSK